MTDRVWVICEDFHSEGLGPPLQAFDGAYEAAAVLAVLRKSAAAPFYRMFELPLWPNTEELDADKTAMSERE